MDLTLEQGWRNPSVTLINNSTLKENLASCNITTLSTINTEESTRYQYSHPEHEPVSVKLVILSIFMIALVAITITGNLVVLLAFLLEKKIRTTFSIYIVNLAIVDLLVAVTAMIPFTAQVVATHWPFGNDVCNIWIFCDYGLTFASVLTLVVISIDRYLSVIRGMRYKRYNTNKRALVMVAMVWGSVMIVWAVPYMLDRVLVQLLLEYRSSCEWKADTNSWLAVLVAVLAHHLPCIIIIFCYGQVIHKMKARAEKLAAYRPNHHAGSIFRFVLYTPSTSDDANSTRSSSPVIPRYTTRRLSLPPCNDSDEEAKKPEKSPTPKVSPKVKRAVSFSSTTSTTDGASIRRIRESDSPRPKPRISHKTGVFKRERRIFVTVSCLLLGYLVCWIPFHIVFDISAVSSKLVPDTAYVLCFVLTYVNSGINPFLYAYSNREFRAAFKKVIFFQFCRK